MNEMPTLEQAAANADHYLLRRTIATVRQLSGLLHGEDTTPMSSPAEILGNIRMIPFIVDNPTLAAESVEMPMLGASMGYATIPFDLHDYEALPQEFVAAAQSLGIDMTTNSTLLRVGYTANTSERAGCVGRLLPVGMRRRL